MSISTCRTRSYGNADAVEPCIYLHGVAGNGLDSRSCMWMNAIMKYVSCEMMEMKSLYILFSSYDKRPSCGQIAGLRTGTYLSTSAMLYVVVVI